MKKSIFLFDTKRRTSRRVPIRRALRLMTDDWIDEGWYSAQTVMDMRDVIQGLLAGGLKGPIK